MSSVRRRKGSKYYHACYTDLNGVQRQRSTRLTNREEAKKLAAEFELAYRKRQTVAYARKVFAEICADVDPTAQFGVATEAFLEGWLEARRIEVSTETHKRYASAIDKFLDTLGPRSTTDIALISTREITEYRNKIATAQSVGTANTDLKILRAAFYQAVRDRHRLDNPAVGVSLLKNKVRDHASIRRPFTATEIVQLLRASHGEMRGMILFGLFTGQRLSDVATIKWGDIRLPDYHLTIQTRKTRRTVIIPLGQKLRDYLSDFPPGEHSAPVFPRACALIEKSDEQARRLSNEFYSLLVKAGLAPKRSKANTGRGHNTKRRTSPLSFHSLRHNATSWLKAAGVPESVVRDIIGHESTIVSRVYTHIDEDQKRIAIEKLDAMVKWEEDGRQ